MKVGEVRVRLVGVGGKQNGRKAREDDDLRVANSRQQCLSTEIMDSGHLLIWTQPMAVCQMEEAHVIGQYKEMLFFKNQFDHTCTTPSLLPE